MIKPDALRYFMNLKEKKAQRHRPLDGICDDINGEIDDLWHESVKKYVPEILWNPEHPDRKITTKGGQGSGNWGHDGLAGVWGGSTPTKNKPKEWQISPDEKGVIFTKSIDPSQHEEIRKIANQMNGFSGIDSETGYKVNTFKIEAEKFETQSKQEFTDILYQGHIYDKSGKSIGDVSLSYCPETKEGEINFIYLGKENRKTGFGRRYIDHVENIFFDEIGAEKIHLIAALDVGGYFWARAGYDFVKPSERREAINWLRKEWMYRYNTEVPSQVLSNLKHTWDIATLIGNDGFKIGKQTMLGVSWRGEKTADGLGRKIGKKYYGIDQP